MKQCHGCGAVWEEYRSPGCSEKCSCGAAWHCCANCRFCETDAQNWCREPAARLEKPRSREQSNYCSWFVFGENYAAAQERAARAARAKEALAALTREN